MDPGDSENRNESVIQEVEVGLPIEQIAPKSKNDIPISTIAITHSIITPKQEPKYYPLAVHTASQPPTKIVLPQGQQSKLSEIETQIGQHRMQKGGKEEEEEGGRRGRRGRKRRRRRIETGRMTKSQARKSS
jgi:hypothetical protein